MTVSAIIVNYHTASFILPLVRGLGSDPNIEQIIVVDNSGELSERLTMLSCHPMLTVLESKNRGFGAAVNQAAAIVQTEWVLVMNPDMLLLDGAVGRMLDGAKRFGSPLVGPRFFWDEQKRFRLPPALGACLWLQVAWESAASFGLDAEIFSFYWILRHDRFWDATAPFFEPFLSGGCLLINRQWALSIEGGIFDERFFLYFEDTDLCARALAAGVRPLCVPDASAIHYIDQSPSPQGRKATHMAQAHAQFLKKYYDGISIPAWKPRHHSHSMVDLGPLNAPPVFDLGRDVPADCFFEVSLNPYFVPFAQAALLGRDFSFPAEVWKRLRPGQYFGRIRSNQEGILGVWTWSKA